MGVDNLVTAFENLIAVGSGAVILFLVTLAIIVIIKRIDVSSALRIIRRKPLIVPALIFLLAVAIVPRQRIGPPPDLMYNYVAHDYTISFATDFQMYNMEPYLSRARVTYTYQMETEEFIECNVLVYQNGSVVANVTTTMYKLDGYQLESFHSIFDLSYGNYRLYFTQTIYTLDGLPSTRHHTVHLIFEQMQDLQWVDESILWDQYILFLLAGGFVLVILGIYVTDHNEDNEVERERYERKKRGERNYPYWRADRRRSRNRQWSERMREKR